jgi:hypothetical protein
MSVVVHRFLHSVRRIQRLIRDFLACKTAKIFAMLQLFDRIETIYIRKKLEQRKLKVQQTLASKQSLEHELQAMNSRILVDFQEHEKNWYTIHQQMNKLITSLKSHRILVEETEEEIIMKLRVQESLKKRLLTSLLEKLVSDNNHNNIIIYYTLYYILY